MTWLPAALCFQQAFAGAPCHLIELGVSANGELVAGRDHRVRRALGFLLYDQQAQTESQRPLDRERIGEFAEEF